MRQPQPQKQITTYKEIYQIAKEQHKMPLFRDIAIILRNEILVNGITKGTAEEVFKYLLTRNVISSDYKGILTWFKSWETYFKNSKIAKIRLKNAKKGYTDISAFL